MVLSKTLLSFLFVLSFPNLKPSVDLFYSPIGVQRRMDKESVAQKNKPSDKLFFVPDPVERGWTKHLVVQKAELHEIPEIVEMVNEAFWEGHKEYLTDSPATRHHAWEDQLIYTLYSQEEDLFVLKDKEKNTLLGAVTFQYPRGQSFASFRMLTVSPDYQGQNLGHHLIQHVENEAQEMGRKFMIIDLFAFTNDLIKYYQSLGYTQMSKLGSIHSSSPVKEEYIPASGRTVIQMSKRLE